MKEFYLFYDYSGTLTFIQNDSDHGFVTIKHYHSVMSIVALETKSVEKIYITQ